ncbi:MAG: DUF1579 domain-containing protein [Bacteroidota bacterium]
MANMTFESSLNKGPHHLLAQFAGTWRGVTRTFFEPGILADESPWEGTIRPVLNGMFMIHEYSGSITGTPLIGTAILGYNIASGQFECSWVDSFHTGTSMMISKGPSSENTFSVLGSYPAPDGSPPWGWRTVFELSGQDTVIIRMNNITPTGEESLAVETIYSRIP